MNTAGGGARKGSGFERLVCRQLSRYLSHGERDDLLWRTPSSGGRATIQMKRGIVNRTMAGDALAIAKEAQEFCDRTYIEAKHYADLQLDRSLLCGTGYLARFWHRTVEEAARYDKRPLLIARQNRFPIIAVTLLTAPVFRAIPLLIQHQWRAELFLFEDVVAAELARQAELIAHRPPPQPQEARPRLHLVRPGTPVKQPHMRLVRPT